MDYFYMFGYEFLICKPFIQVFFHSLIKENESTQKQLMFYSVFLSEKAHTASQT